MTVAKNAQPQADYSQMTNDELNRAVAERLGWTVWKHDNGREWRLTSPDQTFPIRPTESGALSDMPSWATDLNAAITLPLGERDLSINIVEGEHLQVTIEGSTRFPQTIDDIPRELVIIWLQYISVTDDGMIKPER